MPVWCSQNSLQRNEAGWHSFIYKSKDKANTEHEIHIHPNFRPYWIRL